MNIVWLRRDLRLHDHAALNAALDAGGPVQPIFIFDTDILKRFNNQEDARLAFLADTLCALDAELQRRGGRLWVFHGRPQEIIPALKSPVFAAEDFEPGTIARDKEVGKNCTLTLVLDHLIAHPAEIKKDDGTPYKVFTPYSRGWYAAFKPQWVEERKVIDKGRYHTSAAPLPTLSLAQGPAHLQEQIGYRYRPLKEWPAGDAPKRLQHFERTILAGYKTSRDFMATDGTSRLSPYLRFGLVSIRECYRMAAAQLPESPPHRKEFGPEPPSSARKWIAELIWREFYAMILTHFPETVHLEFQPATRGLKWQNDPGLIAAWKEGRTGYPVVDAAMRQLLTTGWMHNRARMIVASFFTKDLLSDWRIGEEHFAQYLMDYELASNVGGWQWAASTGTDAQPYFRIFNPKLQSQRFDPSGDYIRHYVPELKALNAAEIHAPSPLLASGYPAPIVEHAAVKEKAIALFKSATRIS